MGFISFMQLSRTVSPCTGSPPAGRAVRFRLGCSRFHEAAGLLRAVVVLKRQREGETVPKRRGRWGCPAETSFPSTVIVICVAVSSCVASASGSAEEEKSTPRPRKILQSAVQRKDILLITTPQFLSRGRREKTERLLSQQALRLHLEEYSAHLPSSQNLSSITAAWALVAWPWGLRVEPSPVPVMTPAPQAHWRAETAYSDTSKASV